MAGADEPATTQPTTTSAPADATVVVVNGQVIHESDIDDFIRPSFKGRYANEQEYQRLREQIKPRVVEMLIENELIDEVVNKADIKVSAKEREQLMNEQFEAFLIERGIPREQFIESIESRGTTLDAYLAERAAMPSFDRVVRYAKFVEKTFPDKMVVTDEEIKKYYDENRERRFSKPATVRASHILIGVERNASAEEKAEAKKKAEQVLAEVRKPDADFAALAKQYSSCPSKARGGDLGSFPRHGMMDETFAAAAFNLKVDQISDVVETPFGFHIIKVTGKTDAKEQSLDDVKSQIAMVLRMDKLQSVEQTHTKQLRDEAEIEYNHKGGQAPTTQPASS